MKIIRVPKMTISHRKPSNYSPKHSKAKNEWSKNAHS